MASVASARKPMIERSPATSAAFADEPSRRRVAAGRRSDFMFVSWKNLEVERADNGKFLRGREPVFCDNSVRQATGWVSSVFSTSGFSNQSGDRSGVPIFLCKGEVLRADRHRPGRWRQGGKQKSPARIGRAGLWCMCPIREADQFWVTLWRKNFAVAAPRSLIVVVVSEPLTTLLTTS